MRTVLVVDDSAFMRAMMRRIVTSNGYEVVGEAENGRIGVLKYRSLLPDVVTMDITMAEMDGLEALKQIMGINKNARVIMVSAMGQELIVKEAISSGAKGFLLKPYEDSQVINALSNMFK